jgi:hypothetical protein
MMRRLAVVVAVVGLLGVAGCGTSEEGEHPEPSSRGSINPTPEKENGEPSHEFSEEDLERAESASPSVQKYCEGAVSEAQEEGCLSHVEPSEVP